MSTLHTSKKTHAGVPPQPRTLESASADKAKGKDETGRGHRHSRTTGMQHGQGEIPGGLTNHQERNPSSSEQSEGEGDRGLTAPPSITASYVFVLDKHGKPLMPCHPARARKLLKSGRARVHCLVPFVIRLVDKEAEQCEATSVVVKIDPGSKHTGIVLARVDNAGVTHGLLSMQLDHRGGQIKEHMQQRAGYRRRRRSKNLRYRAPRFLNRHPETCKACGKNAKHGKGYCGPCQRARNFQDNEHRNHRLPPSLNHRVDTTTFWVSRVCRWAPVTSIVQELVRFDTQALQDPEIEGVEYQQGTLAGYELREYLLEKWGRKCAYCGAENTRLQVEHIIAQSKGGSNRVSNLTLACASCNKSKDDEDVTTWCMRRFGKEEGKKIAARVLAQAKAPLKDAAAVNATRWALWRGLVVTGLPVETGSGGRTKWNRSRFGLEKSHTLDALCVGKVAGIGSVPREVLVVACTGRGLHQRTKPDKYGFPRLRLPRTKTHHRLRTGDLVRAVVTGGKHKGMHVGRLSVRASGSVFVGKADGIKAKYCTLLQRADGYGYKRKEEAPLLPARPLGSPMPLSQSQERAERRKRLSSPRPDGRGLRGAITRMNNYITTIRSSTNILTYWIVVLIVILSSGIFVSSCSRPIASRLPRSKRHTSNHSHKNEYESIDKTRASMSSSRGITAPALSVQELKSAWLKAEQSFYVASETADWQSPLLTASFSPPALYYIRRALFGWHVQGIVGASRWRLGNVQVNEVGTKTAVVSGCSWSLGTTYASTGRATPVDQGGKPGYAVIRSHLVLSSGSWKVTSQQVQGMRTPEGLCKGL